MLLVDDDSIFLDYLAGHVEQCTGLRPAIASNARQALAHMCLHPTQLLITDTNMPGMSGVDLLTKAKEMDPLIFVIVLFSGLHGSNIGKEEILRLGASMVLTKAEISSRLIPFIKVFAAISSTPSPR
ncbi:MAG: response regulator [Bdellovibrionota bacterium]